MLHVVSPPAVRPAAGHTSGTSLTSAVVTHTARRARRNEEPIARAAGPIELIPIHISNRGRRR